MFKMLLDTNVENNDVISEKIDSFWGAAPQENKALFVAVVMYILSQGELCCRGSRWIFKERGIYSFYLPITAWMKEDLQTPVTKVYFRFSHDNNLSYVVFLNWETIRRG